jgi:hypothetical protein
VEIVDQRAAPVPHAGHQSVAPDLAEPAFELAGAQLLLLDRQRDRSARARRFEPSLPDTVSGRSGCTPGLAPVLPNHRKAARVASAPAPVPGAYRALLPSDVLQPPNQLLGLLSSRQAWRPSGPSSRPTPDSFQPPKGLVACHAEGRGSSPIIRCQSPVNRGFCLPS